MKFIFRHAVASAVLIGGSVALFAALYFSLLLWAMLTGGGIGGPLAFPGMMLIAFAAATISVVGVLAPVTILSQVLRVRFLNVNRLAEIPIATLLASALVFALVHGHPLALYVLVTELILLGAYWWTLQAADALAEGVERAWSWIRRKAGVASYVT